MRTAGSRRMRARALLAVAAAASLALAGCAAPADPSPTDAPADAAPDTTTTPSPTALTEEEALAIAVETYERFLYAERDVLASGGDDSAEMESLITDNMDEYYDGLIDLATSDDFTVEGDLSVSAGEIQSLESNAITFYACIDLQDSQMYGSDGTPRGNNRGGVIQPAEVRVVHVSNTPLIDKSMLWDDSSICQ